MWQVLKFTILFSPHEYFMVSYYSSHFTDKETKARETGPKSLELVSGRTKIQILCGRIQQLCSTVLHCLTHRPWMSMLTSSLTLWSLGHYLTSVNLSFFICKVAETVLHSSRCWENHMGKQTYNTTGTTADPEKVPDKYFPSLPLPHL